jgi:hypothetical protein
VFGTSRARGSRRFGLPELPAFLACNQELERLFEDRLEITVGVAMTQEILSFVQQVPEVLVGSERDPVSERFARGFQCSGL